MTHHNRWQTPCRIMVGAVAPQLDQPRSASMTNHEDPGLIGAETQCTATMPMPSRVISVIGKRDMPRTFSAGRIARGTKRPSM